MAKKKTIVKRRSAEPTVSAIRVSQLDFPSMHLEGAIKVAQALFEDFGGKSGAPHDVALALGLSPTSGGWRMLCGASIAYGLTEGGYAAEGIKLTQLGRKIVAPESDGDDSLGKVEAILRPRVMRLFYEKYDRAKFPQDVIAQNVLVSLGFPRERAREGVEVLKENGRSVGIIRETKTGPFVAIDLPERRSTNDFQDGGTSSAFSLANATPEDESESVRESKASIARPLIPPTNSKVFISHGKNKAVAGQIRELLSFGGFEPIVSVDQEKTAIPVPEKVFQDMRACGAGVIHVSKEVDVIDGEGNSRSMINQNVLIEIGAALALYGRRVVLLVERGTELPSNLQGLYRCEYEGNKLDYDATMKLLKTFYVFK